MDSVEDYVRQKLKQYNENDIVFLKEEWQQWIKEKKFDLIEKRQGANIKTIYNILDLSKIKSIRSAKYYSDRYEIRLKHSRRFEIVVIIIFDQPKEGDLGVVTYYKCLITN